MTTSSSNNNLINQYLNTNKNTDDIDKIMNNNNLTIIYPEISCSTSSDVINDYLKINSFTNFSNNFEHFNNLNISRNIWVYWENINNKPTPTFINLCLKSMRKYLSKYNLIILNETNIKQYLPNVRNDFENLKIAQKVDYYRIELLYKYGGIWVDSDIIVMKDFDIIFNKLDEGYDFVGFGCTGYYCNNGYMRPSNWVMGAKQNSILMYKCLELLTMKLDNNKLLKKNNNNDNNNDDTYHDYGKYILWEALDILKRNNNYTYYHFTSEYDGARDINKNWIHIDNFFNINKTTFLDENKLLFVVLYNSEFSSNEKYKWIYTCSEDKLLNSDIWLSYLFRKSLT